VHIPIDNGKVHECNKKVYQTRYWVDQSNIEDAQNDKYYEENPIHQMVYVLSIRIICAQLQHIDLHSFHRQIDI